LQRGFILKRVVATQGRLSKGAGGAIAPPQKLSSMYS